MQKLKLQSNLSVIKFILLVINNSIRINLSIGKIQPSKLMSKCDMKKSLGRKKALFNFFFALRYYYTLESQKKGYFQEFIAQFLY